VRAVRGGRSRDDSNRRRPCRPTTTATTPRSAWPRYARCALNVIIASTAPTGGRATRSARMDADRAICGTRACKAHLRSSPVCAGHQTALVFWKFLVGVRCKTPQRRGQAEFTDVLLMSLYLPKGTSATSEIAYQNGFQVELLVNLSQPKFAPSRRPIPERIGTTTILFPLSAVMPKPPTR
jgi:hypothetical protein